MRKLLPALLLSMLALTACTDKKYQTFMANVPRYLSYEDLRASFSVEAGKVLEKPGKFYLLGTTMYINEYSEGIHVVDLSDPAHPQALAFISIPGNMDMAVKDHVLYADSYVDLVMVDISDPSEPAEIGRMEDVFEYVVPAYDYNYPLAEIDQDKGVVSGFVVEMHTQEIHHQSWPWPIYRGWYALDAASSHYSGGSAASVGVAGSMARFLTYDNYLYTLESTYFLRTIDISDLENPLPMEEKYLNGNVETLFIEGSHMYVGTSNGMHILSLEEPAFPALLSTYRHITACDPVVVSGNLAYVTLRSGNLCGGDVDRLDVIDISSKSNPTLLASHPMTEPYGLGIDQSSLFICEGEHGLKVFDATDPHKIPQNKLAEFTGIHAYDVIPAEGLLFAIGDSGFRIYDYSDLQDIRLLGKLPTSWEDE